MGSDRSPQVLLDCAIKVSKELPEDHSLILLIQEGLINPSSFNLPQIKFIECKQVVEMDDNPLLAVRRKKDSTMAVGISLLKKKEVDALVSAGNTGALMAMATFQLSLIKGIERPALLAELPTKTGSVCVLDVGANIQCRPSHLVQFALMGAKYQNVLHGNTCPQVGLLNIGTESLKGTSELQATYQKLKEYCQNPEVHMQFYGNVEGNDVFKGKVDVLVTDGFTGNIFLKTAEGVSGFILDFVGDVLAQHKKDAANIINEMQKYLNYAEYYGAVLAGLDGLVIKVHGYSSPQAFINGIHGALRLSNANFISNIKTSLEY
jgi:glycerol-3-phosphate acyltransferase PlsX